MKDVKEYKLVCEKCGKEFSVFLTESQYSSLKKRGKLKRFCSRTCANSHIVTNETKEKISNGVRKFMRENDKSPVYNKNIHYTKTGRKSHCVCKVCGCEYDYISGESFSRIFCSQECKHTYLSTHTGGKRHGSGRGKKGWYKGIFCDSSWELAFVIYHLDHNLNISRCTENRTYEWKGKVHTYIPDFVTDEGVIEIKGYDTEQWQEKIKQNQDVKVLYKDDMQPYLNYCRLTYGDDFLSLYDNSSPKDDMSGFDSCWFFKKNDEKKLFIKVLVFKSNFELYINNGWKRGGYSSMLYGDYKLISHNIQVRGKITHEEKEKYLSSLIK